MMTPLSGILFHLQVAAFLTVLLTRSVQCVTKCNIPPGSSALSAPNRDAIDFAITDIKSAPDFISLAIEDHMYTVEACFLVLYIKSATIDQDLLPSDTKLSGTPLSCRPLGENAVVQANGTILRYIDDALAKPDAVPDAWYEGSRLVIRIQFFVFPETSSLKIRCGLNQRHAFVGQVEVFQDITITKIGCPKTHWGTNCNKACFCENDGYCNTFEDGCVCTGNYDGATCNIHFGASTPEPASSANTTLNKNHTSEMATTAFTYTTSFQEKPRDDQTVLGDGVSSTTVHSMSYILQLLCPLLVLLWLTKCPF